MRNTWLVIQREYLERVRKRSFLISTLLLPALMFAMIVLPSKLATLKAGGQRRIVVVVSNAEFGEAVKQEIMTGAQDQRSSKPNADRPDRSLPASKYTADVDLNTAEIERAVLRSRVSAGDIDGYIWATDEALAARKISYSARETSDFIETIGLTHAVTQASLKRQLQARGLTATEITDLFKDLEMETNTIKAGAESKVNGGALAFMGPLVMVMLMYMTVLLYAMAVMRAVLEEKNSRVMEVLLSSITAKEMMAGKILGVGAVGVTQIAIWVALCVPFVGPALASGTLAGVQLPTAAALAWFGVFYALGFVLYSTMYAALGAMVNSEQEAQQWQTFIMMPLILAIMVMMFIIRQPNSPLAFWGSMVPFLSPIVMYARIAVQTPPLWQVVLSIILLLATIYGMVALCGRIYRVGILMYGKRPTLPEIMRWVKYA